MSRFQVYNLSKQQKRGQMDLFPTPNSQLSVVTTAALYWCLAYPLPAAP